MGAGYIPGRVEAGGIGGKAHGITHMVAAVSLPAQVPKTLEPEGSAFWRVCKTVCKVWEN